MFPQAIVRGVGDGRGWIRSSDDRLVDHPSPTSIAIGKAAVEKLHRDGWLRTLLPILRPLFAKLHTLSWKGAPLRANARWFVMGQVCVAESHRGRGVFDGLYRTMAATYADRFDFTVTEVAARNTRSLRAHARVGFETLHVYPDATTGEEWLVEVNPRLWGSIPLAVHAGIDFPFHQVAYFLHGRRPAMSPDGIPPVGARQLSAELIRLAHAWQGPPAGWERGYPTFATALKEFVDGFREGMRYYHQSTEDPLPGVAEPIANLVAGLRKAAV